MVKQTESHAVEFRFTALELIEILRAAYPELDAMLTGLHGAEVNYEFFIDEHGFITVQAKQVLIQ